MKRQRKRTGPPAPRRGLYAYGRATPSKNSSRATFVRMQRAPSCGRSRQTAASGSESGQLTKRSRAAHSLRSLSHLCRYERDAQRSWSSGLARGHAQECDAAHWSKQKGTASPKDTISVKDFTGPSDVASSYNGKSGRVVQTCEIMDI